MRSNPLQSRVLPTVLAVAGVLVIGLSGCGSEPFDRIAHARSVSPEESKLVGFWRATVETYKPKAAKIAMDEIGSGMNLTIDPNTIEIDAEECPGFHLFDDGTFETVWDNDPFAIRGTWSRTNDRLTIESIEPDWGTSTFSITDAGLSASSTKDEGLAGMFSGLEMTRIAGP
jgi:hypothetical protein